MERSYLSHLKVERSQPRSRRAYWMAAPILGGALGLGYYFGFASYSSDNEARASTPGESAAAPADPVKDGPASEKPAGPAGPKARSNASEPITLASLGTGFNHAKKAPASAKETSSEEPPRKDPPGEKPEPAPVKNPSPAPKPGGSAQEPEGEKPVPPVSKPAPEEAKEAPKAAAADEPIPTPVGFKNLPTAAYKVESGDMLVKVGKKFRIPFELIQRLNGLTGTNIRAGQGLSVAEGPFHVEVRKSRRTLILFHKGEAIETFPVAVGKDNLTPAGKFEVQKKMVKPPWTNPQTGRVYVHGEEGYQIGTRWIQFADGLGIHGTDDESSIGQAVSLGCIRMKNKDVEVIYDYLSTPSEGRGEPSTVTIRE